MNQKIIPSLWFVDGCEDALNFYTSIFPNSQITHIQRYPDKVDFPPWKGLEGKIITATFELNGQKFIALDGGPMFKLNPSISLAVNFKTAEEVETLYNKLIEGGKPLMPLDKYPWSEKYGWLEDRWGLSWQISVGQNTDSIVPAYMFVGEHFGQAEEAINFYTSIFKDSSIDLIARYEPGEQDQEGKVKYAGFKLEGQKFSAMESSHDHKFAPNGAVSMMVECQTQDEIDYYWDKLTAGGNEAAQQCGWLQDKYGFSWQIVPKRLGELLSNPDKTKADKAMQAMLKMKKLVIADLEESANS